MTAAMSTTGGAAVNAPLGLASGGLTKAMILPAAVISVGALATAIALSLSPTLGQQTPPVAEALTREAPAKESKDTEEKVSRRSPRRSKIPKISSNPPTEIQTETTKLTATKGIHRLTPMVMASKIMMQLECLQC